MIKIHQTNFNIKATYSFFYCFTFSKDVFESPDQSHGEGLHLCGGLCRMHKYFIIQIIRGIKVLELYGIRSGKEFKSRKLKDCRWRKRVQSSEWLDQRRLEVTGPGCKHRSSNVKTQPFPTCLPENSTGFMLERQLPGERGGGIL